MKRYILLLLCCVVWLSVFSTLPGEAKEPDPPEVGIPLSSDKEAWIQDLAKKKDVARIFDDLKKAKVYTDNDFFNKAAYAACQGKEDAAIEHALNFLKRPHRSVEQESAADNSDFYVAKGILRVMPELSNGHLKQIYKSADATTKGNIISVLGKMADEKGQTVKKLLVDALNDKDFYEEENPHIMGEPLRVCDAAYNQLVLRYSIDDVIHTIGNVHDIETRDYHIKRIKSRLP